MIKNKINWLLVVLVALLVGAVGLLLLWALPEKRGAVLLGLYTIPSHMFVSPFSHEPVLLYYAKTYSALDLTIASTAGALIAGLLDYWLFIPLVHHPRLRTKYVNTGLYKRSVRAFRKWPFWTLVVAGALPIPFYPVKFLAISDHYPLKSYLGSLIVGRTPRYFVLAWAGSMLHMPNWSLIGIALIFLVITVLKSRNGDSAENPDEAPVVTGEYSRE